MAELVADCPRCGSQKITFDVRAAHPFKIEWEWQTWYEAFSVCRQCDRTTTFVLSEIDPNAGQLLTKVGFDGIKGALNQLLRVERYINLKDLSTVPPPEHTPEDIADAFSEGATCLAVECWNAAGAMFRLCVDHATRPLLPPEDVDGLNRRIRRDLGLRLPWLIQDGRLPAALKELASCIREEGNDGVHAGTLSKVDAEEVMDFTALLLERLFTEPKRLELAEERRKERRATKPTGAK